MERGAPSDSPGNPFAALDEYELRNLVSHLAASGRERDLHRVLELSTDSGRNAWYEAQLALGDAAGFAADVARGWDAAEAAADVGREVRYALITSTLDSLAGNVPPELAVAAVQADVWSAKRTLALVRQLQNPTTRATALAAIQPHVADELQAEVVTEFLAAMTAAAAAGSVPTALVSELPAELLGETGEQLAAIAAAIPDPANRADALRELAKGLSEPARTEAFRGALEAARAISDDPGFLPPVWRVLVEMPMSLREEAKEAALAEAEASSKPADARLSVLIALASQLADAEVIEAVGLARARKSWNERLTALSSLGSKLPRPVLDEVVDRARTAGSKPEQAATLAELAEWYPEPISARMLDDALAAAGAIRAHEARAVALARLLPRLPDAKRGPVVDQCLDALRRGGSILVDEVLVDVAQYASEPQLIDVLELARQRHVQSETLAALAERVPPRLRGPLIQTELAAARAEDWPLFQVRAIARILPRLSPAVLDQVALEALEVTRSIEVDTYRVEALAALAPHLPPGVLPEAIDVAQNIGDGRWRTLLLLELAPHVGVPLEAEVMHESLRFTRTSGFGELIPILVRLGPRLPASLLEEACRVIVESLMSDATSHERARGPDDGAIADALAALAPLLPDAVLPAAIELASAIVELEHRAHSLAALAPRLSGDLLEQALAEARAIPAGAHADGKHGGARNRGADALALIAPFLDEPARTDTLEEALGIARQTPRERERAEALADLAPHLPPERRPDAVRGALAALAAAMIDDNSAARVLGTVAPYVTESTLPTALRIARALDRDTARARALAALAAQLAPPHRDRVSEEALGAAQELDASKSNDQFTIALLVEVAESMEQPSQSTVLRQALDVALAVEFPASFFEQGFRALAPHLSLDERQHLVDRALDDARSRQADDDAIEVLLASAPYLAERSEVEALCEALALVQSETKSTDVALRKRTELPPLDNLSRDALRAIWTPTLRDYSNEPRASFLMRLRDLVPLIVALEGEPGASGVRDAVLDTTRWWP